jgi:hypothetical protein
MVTTVDFGFDGLLLQESSMVKLVTRVLLALLLFVECADRLAASDANLSPCAVADAPGPDEDCCFAPIALRYRQEVIQRVSSHRLAWTMLPREACQLAVPEFADHLDQPRRVSLADLDPVYAFMCVRR